MTDLESGCRFLRLENAAADVFVHTRAVIQHLDAQMMRLFGYAHGNFGRIR